MAYVWSNFDKRSSYFWGVGVGLLIAWVTGGIVYLKGLSGQPVVLLDLIVLGVVVSMILFLVAYLINTGRKK